MILSLLRKDRFTDEVYAVYNAIVAQSRHPLFYAEWGVPDTLTGRFDMISVHMCLVQRRLRGGKGEARVFAQSLVDLFFRDMDRSLREMGVGDLSVPKRIKKMGNLFYGLLGKLSEALDGEDEAALRTTILRNIYGEETTDATDRMTAYVAAAAARLDVQPIQEILAGTLEFDTPA